MSSDTVMTTWTPLIVRTTGRYPPQWGVMGPPSVPCRTGRQIVLIIAITTVYDVTSCHLLQSQKVHQKLVGGVDQECQL